MFKYINLLLIIFILNNASSKIITDLNQNYNGSTSNLDTYFQFDTALYGEQNNDFSICLNTSSNYTIRFYSGCCNNFYQEYKIKDGAEFKYSMNSSNSKHFDISEYTFIIIRSQNVSYYNLSFDKYNVDFDTEDDNLFLINVLLVAIIFSLCLFIVISVISLISMNAVSILEKLNFIN